MEMHEILSTEALVCLLAEEAAELAAATSKLERKILYPSNPTPKTAEECFDAVNEEFADVLLVASQLSHHGICTRESVESWLRFKDERWKERMALKGAEQ